MSISEMTSFLFEPKSPFLKGSYYYFSHKNHGKCGKCSTCAYLYIKKRSSGAHSMIDDPSGVIRCTDETILNIPGTFFKPSSVQTSKELTDKLTHVSGTTLLQGTALYHTEREIDLDNHVESQTCLLLDTYTTLINPNFQDRIRCEKKLSLVKNNELIMYSELTHPYEKALISRGNKITHPHSWVRANLQKFGEPHTVIHFPSEGLTPSQFITMTVLDGTNILEENLNTKVYIKYFLDASDYSIKRCEIDVENPDKTKQRRALDV